MYPGSNGTDMYMELYEKGLKDSFLQSHAFFYELESLDWLKSAMLYQ